ncbi:MAG: DUF885 domain-containing protein [Lachnospiraceae bacterium]|nr:DUF885 domain-containing protein [Lachnospiraceae bacterium]
MKSHRKNLLQVFAFLVCGAIIFLIFYYGKSGHFFGLEQISENARFNALCSELFVSELSSDSLSLHFTLRDPSLYGISGSEVTLPVYSRESERAAAVSTENARKRLKKIRRDSLSDELHYSYDVLEYYLANSLEGCRFSYLDEPFSAFSGVQTEFPLLLSEYAFDTKRDVENYLKILECSGSYLKGLMEYEKEKSAAGLFMSDAEAQKVISWCDDFTSSAKNHILVTTFEKKLDTLLAEEEISSSERNYYISQNDRLLTTILFPAYEALGDCLTVLKGTGKDQAGLCHDKNGKKYYEYLVKSKVGTDKSIPEIKALLTDQLQSDFLLLHSTVAALPSGAYESFRDPLEALTPVEILEDIKTRMTDQFPFAPDASYSYTVKDVDSSLEAYTSPAYYFTPPLDAISQNVIYINHSTTDKGIDLYTTLAHEGFPGHLYQSVAFQTCREREKLPPLRSLLYFGGYIEGYATYTEMLSYDYAARCGSSLSKDSSLETIYQAVALDRSIQLCLYSLLDIMIHYEGMSPEEIAPYLHNLGITDNDTIDAIYFYIGAEPANYLKYYLGYLEILECRELAKANWGNSYSDARFHQLLLQLGPSPFPLIKEAILDTVWNGSYLLLLKNSAKVVKVFSNTSFSGSSNCFTICSIISS